MSTPASAADADVETGNAGASNVVKPLEIRLPDDPETGKVLKPLPETTVMERIAGGVALCAVVTALAAIIVEQSAVVIVGGTSVTATAYFAWPKDVY